ncbi:MAG: stage III sporulation protein AG [Lachnospiraceae bacterium]|nr:stage III sporulation protein AG [Lachnospiraceae bacterium]
MKKERFSMDRLKKISKNQLLIGGLAGVLLLIIAIPVENREQAGEDQQQKEVQQGSVSDRGGDYGKRLERRLEQALKDMEGVGKVKVMITLQDEGELVLEKDWSQSSQEISEEDSGAKRSTKERQSQEETVYSQSSGSTGEPFVKREVTPRVEGVLVVAEGGGDSKIVKNISDAVLALFPVEVHKIKVVKMN